MRTARWGLTYDLLARTAVVCDLLSLRAAKFLRAGGKRFVEVVLLTGALHVLVVIHFGG